MKLFDWQRKALEETRAIQEEHKDSWENQLARRKQNPTAIAALSILAKEILMPPTKKVNYWAICPKCHKKIHVQGEFSWDDWDAYKERTHHTANPGTGEVYELCGECLQIDSPAQPESDI